MSRIVVIVLLFSVISAAAATGQGNVLSYSSYNAKEVVECESVNGSEDLKKALIRVGWSNKFPTVDFTDHFAVLIAKPGLKKNMALRRVSRQDDGLVLEWELQEIQGTHTGAGYADLGSSAPLDLLLIVVSKGEASPDKTTCKAP